MDSSIYRIAENLLIATKEKYKGDYTNVPEILTFWHNTMFLFFSSVNHKKLFNRTDEWYGEMTAWGLMPEYLCVFYETNKKIISQYIDAAIEEYFSIDTNTNNIRQKLLNIELDFSGGKLELFSDKISRDNTGAYYTPKELALEIIKKSFDGRTFDALKEYRIADFSCGGGDFFLAVMEHLEERYSIEKKVSVRWFYGIDIDPIALQICIVNLLVCAEQKDWKTIISHFVFGNPLVMSNGENSEEKKNTLFATRRLYSSGLGLQAEFFDISFDVVVGNPPWEKIRFEERKFFRGISSNISSASQKSVRDKEVEKLKNYWSIVFDWRNQVCDEYSMMTAVNFKHCKIKDSVAGELNTYALFTDLAFNMLSASGFLALVVKSTLVTAPVNHKLWTRFLEEKAVRNVFLFENKKKIFRIDSRERFIVFIAGKEKTKSFEFATGLTEPGELQNSETVLLDANALKIINPFTTTIPNVSDNREIKFLKKAHNRFKLFSEEYPDCHFGRLIHLTAHAASISKKQTEGYIPIYEGKFLEQYDSRYATFKGMSESKKYANKASAIRNVANTEGVKEWPESRYFVEKELWDKYLRQYGEDYSLCWRSLTSSTNRRTMLAMIIPTCPTCQSVQMLQTKDQAELIMILSLFNSIPFDYFVRIKMPGLDLTQSVVKQIPVPSKADYDEVIEFEGRKCTLRKHILSYTLSILKEEERLAGLVSQFENAIYAVKEQDALQKQKMIDFLFKKAYDLDEDDYKEILLTFPKYQEGHTV